MIKCKNMEKDNNLQEDIVIEEDVDNAAASIKNIKEKLKKCETERMEYLTGWQLAKADFVNARKDDETKKTEFIKFAEAGFALELLELADSFDRLFANEDSLAKLDENWRQGFEALRGQLVNILKGRGVEPMESIGKKFDPKDHESIGEVDIDKAEKDGIVMEEMRKGYKMREKIIRPSLVKIGKFKS
ncbi:TPA: nucleotide exchange factor GrpE [Patescibacteria group bacterium]|nr:nucleotide exchange factor GrpE [Patescibacteria group bacterium]HCI04464.1 nucleotide exchange factor GrpE [Patescibacteria group bacterium]